jgi:hypothetical protein
MVVALALLWPATGLAAQGRSGKLDNVAASTILFVRRSAERHHSNDARPDNIVWGTGLIGVFDGQSVIWGTCSGDEDNIVWGTLDEDNIVWGTSANQISGLGTSTGGAL